MCIFEVSCFPIKMLYYCVSVYVLRVTYKFCDLPRQISRFRFHGQSIGRATFERIAIEAPVLRNDDYATRAPSLKSQFTVLYDVICLLTFTI